MTDKKAIRWLYGAAQGYKVNMVLLLLLQMLVNGGAVCYALVMKKMVDSAVSGNRTDFIRGLITFGLLMAVLILLRILLRQIEEATKSGLESGLRKRLFEKLLSKDYAQVSAVHSEEWMNRMTSDTSVCAGGMTDIVPGFTGMLVRMVGALGMMLVLQPGLAYLLVPGGIAFVGITLWLRKYLKGQHKRVQEKDGAVRVYLQERISSMLILRTFGVEQEALKGADEELSEYRKARMRKAFVSNLCNSGFSVAINGMYLIGIGYCGFGIVNGVVSYGTLTAIIQLIGQLQAPLSGLSGFVPRFYACLASAERLMEVEEYKDACRLQVLGLKETKELYAERIREIVFDKVSFDYDNGEAVLCDVGFSAYKGDFIAFTGASGCGKSTLLKLLMGVYEPKCGRIEVLLSNTERMPVASLKRLFAYVPQGNFLMGGTIREVITFGREEAEQSMTVERALKLSCGEFVSELPNGLDTVLGEKGAGLSEGQMQRIAIARALYTDAPVLILDEATSALDSDTEKALLYNLKQLTDKTVFIVTHRPEALNICNRRLEFSENGRVLQGLEVADHG